MGIRFVRRRSRLLVVTVLVTGAVALLAGSAWSAAPRPAPRPPTASTGGVSNVTYSSAILHGYVEPARSGHQLRLPVRPDGRLWRAVAARSGWQRDGLDQGQSGRHRPSAGDRLSLPDRREQLPAGRSRAWAARFGRRRSRCRCRSSARPIRSCSAIRSSSRARCRGRARRRTRSCCRPTRSRTSGGFKTVGNPEVANSAGGFSFPFLGLLENAQLRVVTVGRPVVVEPGGARERRCARVLPRAPCPPPWVCAPVWHGRPGGGRRARRLPAACGRAGRSTRAAPSSKPARRPYRGSAASCVCAIVVSTAR